MVDNYTSGFVPRKTDTVASKPLVENVKPHVENVDLDLKSMIIKLNDKSEITEVMARIWMNVNTISEEHFHEVFVEPYIFKAWKPDKTSVMMEYEGREAWEALNTPFVQAMKENKIARDCIPGSIIFKELTPDHAEIEGGYTAY